jgi:glycosyltransferase involved in cell wall biosynthesis
LGQRGTAQHAGELEPAGGFRIAQEYSIVKKMKIAVVAPPEETVPPPKYGGIELVVFNIVESLVTLGHDVTLFASGDSKTSAKLFALSDTPLRTQPRCKDLYLREAFKIMGIGKALRSLQDKEFDIIHNHIGWNLLPFSYLLPAPVVTTLHGPLDVERQREVYGAYPDAAYVSISLSQRRPLPQLNYVANVYNGINTAIFPFSEKPQDYYAFLGRMSPEKGPVEAITIAKKAGVKLKMAAKIDPLDEDFFQNKVKPLIDNQQITFLGEVDHAGKIELLGNAKALIAPIQWEEPFGLFFVEAMACGTPVITMKRGSTPEIIIDGTTGFLCNDIDQAVSAVSRVSNLDRRASYDHVQNNFSITAMTSGYLALFERLIAAART